MRSAHRLQLASARGGSCVRLYNSPSTDRPRSARRPPSPRVAQMLANSNSRYHLRFFPGALVALLAASPAIAQTASTESHAATAAPRDSAKTAKEAGPKPKSVYGVNLTRAEARA